VFGADVTHPSPGDRERPSIAAVVGTLGMKAVTYAASIRVQESRKETITELPAMVKELLLKFRETCGKTPSQILFYRDGVSEGQFDEVLENEVAGIRAACVSLNPAYKPKITFVVAQKRHHARFFPLRREDADNSGNCLPGTVVDTHVVHPFEFDFYLQSHSGLQGTSRSCHYHVLCDENNFSSDSLQDLTYKLCHVYARCTRTVSLVTPAYYAHLVAARARFYSRNEVLGNTESGETSAIEKIQLSTCQTRSEQSNVFRITA